MNRCMITALALASALILALAGCGGGGGGGGNSGGDGGGGTPGDTIGNTIITGTVVNQEGQKVQGVKITIGDMPATKITKITDANGRFRFDLGYNVLIYTLYANPTLTNFVVSTQDLGPTYPNLPVIFGSVGYNQVEGGGAYIPLPYTVLAGQGKQTDLGTIMVRRFYDDTQPPGPPF
ncbi:MAG: carboxypeptidase-like regulatory domain-containing protein [Armatimonadota bacterium]|jgi:hypothetical protein